MYFDSLKADVLLFLEHRDRELEVIVEIARRLKRVHGLKVAVASTIFDRTIAPLILRPRTVVFHSNKSLPPIFHNLYGARVRYVCLNWEQMLSVFNKMAAKKPDDELNKLLMNHCAWGRNYRDFLLDIGIPEQNIRVTGRPSMTLLKQKAERGTDVRRRLAERFHLDPRKTWLFFPLTCLHAFSSDDLVRAFVRNERLSNQVDLDLAFARRDYVRETIHRIFSWIASLEDRRGPPFQIILRPHPLISVTQHRELFREHFGGVPSYVFPNKELSAHEWLIASDICYTNYSSLALDAYFIRKPAYLLEPEPYPEFLAYEWFEGFTRIKTLEHLVRSIQEAPSRTGTVEVIEDQFDSALDGIKETADLVAEQTRNTAKSPSFSWGRWAAAVLKDRRTYIDTVSLLRFLKMNLGIRTHSMPEARRYDFFSAREIRMRLEREELFHGLQNP